MFFGQFWGCNGGGGNQSKKDLNIESAQDQEARYAYLDKLVDQLPSDPGADHEIQALYAEAEQRAAESPELECPQINLDQIEAL